MGQALRNRWPMSEERRNRILDRLMRVVENELAEDRTVVAAAKALIDADKINVQCEMRGEDGVEEVTIRRVARRIDRAGEDG
jgi:hypothetical protein